MVDKEIKKERIKYKVPDDGSSETHENVWLNGENFKLKKGAWVEIPPGVAEIIETRNERKRKQRDALKEARNKAKGFE